MAKPSKKSSKTKPMPWIAERRLERRDAVGGIVMVRVGIPEIDLPYDNWRCPFLIEGLGDDSIQYGKSDDSMAALQNAFRGIRCVLEQSGIPLRWEGMEDGDTGFPMDADRGYGIAFQKRLEKMILAEEDEYVRMRSERRKAPRAARKTPKKKAT
jgi:hypothetical protein